MVTIKGYSEWNSMQSAFNLQFKGRRRDNHTWVHGFFHPETYIRPDPWLGFPAETTTYYITYHVPVDSHGRVCSEGDTWHIHNHMKSLMVEVDRDSICQSTGMYDKNNTMIYEGDFVKKTEQDGAERIYYVYYVRGKCTIADIYTPTFTCSNNTCNWECLHHDNSIEIIGNRFDNEDLRDALVEECKKQLAELDLTVWNQFSEPESLDYMALKDAIEEINRDEKKT